MSENERLLLPADDKERIALAWEARGGNVTCDVCGGDGSGLESNTLSCLYVPFRTHDDRDIAICVGCLLPHFMERVESMVVADGEPLSNVVLYLSAPPGGPVLHFSKD